MNETEWLKCQDWHAMLLHLRRRRDVTTRKSGRRKLRLLACGCCRQQWGLLVHPHSRPIAMKRACRTATAVQLARGIYLEHAFDRMPILADALQDAGCDDEAVLSHCRHANGIHIRGCWVVDAIAGRK